MATKTSKKSIKHMLTFHLKYCKFRLVITNLENVHNNFFCFGNILAENGMKEEWERRKKEWKRLKLKSHEIKTNVPTLGSFSIQSFSFRWIYYYFFQEKNQIYTEERANGERDDVEKLLVFVKITFENLPHSILYMCPIPFVVYFSMCNICAVCVQIAI